MPETMSRTSDWLPNDTARPNTEAPAISGVMLTPSCDSTSRPPRTRMTTPAMTRSTGMRVRSRDAATWRVVVGIALRSRPTAAGCRRCSESMRYFRNRQNA